VGVASKVMSRVPARLLVPAIAWQYRFFEPELGKLDQFVPRDRGAVDAGVWWGPWTWWLARRVPRVDSFEPNPDLVARLEPVMPSNVTLHPVALSDRSGESNLWVPSGGMGTEGRASLEPANRPESEWTQQTVSTCRLDDFELGDVGFVKIDVEGHELAVLKGATNLLKAQRPNVLIEIEQHSDRQGHLDTIIEFFGDCSYSGEFLQRGRWHPIEELDRQSVREMANHVARHGYATNLVLYARRYVHNFVFKPR
jgi:FkbM family methyltransferase